MTAKDRPLPCDSSAETAVVSSLLIYGDAVSRISGWLRPNHFYNQDAAKVYAAILALTDEQQPVDDITVSDKLVEGGMDVTDARRLVGAWGVGNHMPDVTNLAHHAKIVKRDADRRSAIRQCETAMNAFWENSDVSLNASRLMTTAVELLEEARSAKPLHSMGDLVKDSLKRLDTVIASEGSMLSGIPTGYYCLDGVMSGWQRGVVTLIAALPSAGKTTLALNGVLRAAQAGANCLLFSLDMPERLVSDRCLSILSGVDSNFIRTGKHGSDTGALFNHRPYQDLLMDCTRAAQTMAKLPIMIDDSSSDIAQIMAESRLYAKSNTTPDLIVVDFIQMVTNRQHGKESLHSQISDTMLKLKGLAKMLNCAVIVLSQFNRTLQRGERPTMRHLAESSSLEQVPRNILILDRPWVQDRNRLPCETHLYTEKLSEGNPHDISLHFDAHAFQFNEREHDDSCPFVAKG